MFFLFLDLGLKVVQVALHIATDLNKLNALCDI